MVTPICYVVNISQKHLKINKILVGSPGNPLNPQLLHMQIFEKILLIKIFIHIKV